MGMWCGSSVLTAAEPFPFGDERWNPYVKEIMKRLWENDPTYVDAK